MGAAPIDLSAGLQPKGVDLSAGLQPKQQNKGFVSSFADSSGLSALAHPIDTLMGIPHALAQQAKDSYQGIKQGVSDYQKNGMDLQTRRDFGFAIPVLGPALKQADQQYNSGDKAGMLGTLLGTAAGFAAPEAGSEASAALKASKPAIGGALEAVGDAAQSQAGKVINRATGTLKADFKRGANPGRGYLAQGGGMASSMGDLADKAEAVKAATGDKIRQAYVDAGKGGVQIPVTDVVGSLQGPMKSVYDALDEGGAPASLKTSIEEHAQSFEKPLQRGIQQGYFTPSQVWDLKKNIADFTNWGDQSQKTLNLVKQQQVGALSGLLTDAIPELADLNQGYQDLTKMASRARERANTGSQPLTSHMYDVGSMLTGSLLGAGEHGGVGAIAGAMAGKALRSVPARTAIAEGLYKGGGALSDLGASLRAGAEEAQPSAGVSVGPRLQAGGENANQSVANPVPNQGIPSGWVDLGAAKLNQHIKALPSPKLTAADVDALKSTPFGQRILASASGLLPRSKAMAALMYQIAAQKQQKDNQ